MFSKKFHETDIQKPKPYNPTKFYLNAKSKFLARNTRVDKHSTYLTSLEKKQYKVYRDNNGLYRKINGQRVPLEDGSYQYVISPKGGLYVRARNEYSPRADTFLGANGEETKRQFHSEILAANPCQCAGELHVVNGKITDIENFSGHYLPDKIQLIEAVIGLFLIGLLEADACVGNVRGVTVSDLISKFKPLEPVNDAAHSFQIEVIEKLKYLRNKTKVREKEQWLDNLIIKIKLRGNSFEAIHALLLNDSSIYQKNIDKHSLFKIGNTRTRKEIDKLIIKSKNFNKVNLISPSEDQYESLSLRS